MDGPQHHDRMVFVTHVRIRLNVAHGSQGQSRKQVLVTKIRADHSSELARDALSRRVFQQFEQHRDGSIRRSKAEPAAQAQAGPSDRVDERSSVHRSNPILPHARRIFTPSTSQMRCGRGDRRAKPGRAARWARSSGPRRLSGWSVTRSGLVIRVGVGGQHPAIILDYASGTGFIGKNTCKVRPVFRHGVAAEGIGSPRDKRASQAPLAPLFVRLCRKDRVEVRVWWRIGASRTGSAVAAAAKVGGLDPWQIGLERDPRVVALLSARIGKQWTRERDRCGVQSSIERGATVGTGPDQLIRNTGKIRVGTETTDIGDETSCVTGGIDTVHVVIPDQIIVGVQIVHTVCDAVIAKDITEGISTGVAGAGVDLIAVLVVPDLIGKRSVLTVSRPGISRVLVRRGEGGMKVGGLGRAGIRMWLKAQLAKPVGGAGNHRALFAGRQVVERYLQSMRSVRELDAQHITRIEEQRVVVVWSEAGETGTPDERAGALG